MLSDYREWFIILKNFGGFFAKFYTMSTSESRRRGVPLFLRLKYAIKTGGGRWRGPAQEYCFYGIATVSGRGSGQEGQGASFPYFGLWPLGSLQR
jgi:hypothetical protein